MQQDIDADEDAAAVEPDATVQHSTVDNALREKVDGMIKDATDTAENNVRYCKKLVDELKAGEHIDVVEEMVRQVGGKVYKTYNSNRNQVVTWLEADPRARPFLFMTVPKLKVRTALLAMLLVCVPFIQ